MGSLFSKLVVVGVGLLGGSVGQAARRAGVADRVIGLFRSDESANRAIQCEAVDHAVFNLYDALREESSDKKTDRPILIVVCSPVGVIVEQITGILSCCNSMNPPLKQRCIITDVGSTKEHILSALDRKECPGNIACIGSHPIAGSEKSGVEAAMFDLFVDKTTVLVPSRHGTQYDLATVREFWERLGSRCLTLTAEEHDRHLALTSHLPHLLSASLALLVEEEDYTLTGTGFSDLTRLAGGNPEVWGDIFDSNGNQLNRAIEQFEMLLSRWKALLAERNREQIITLLKEAKKKRDALGN